MEAPPGKWNQRRHSRFGFRTLEASHVPVINCYRHCQKFSAKWRDRLKASALNGCFAGLT